MKQITKDDFTEIVAKAVSKEVEEFTDSVGNGMEGMVLTLMGASIGAKIMGILFDDEEEIEIITDKE